MQQESITATLGSRGAGGGSGRNCGAKAMTCGGVVAIAPRPLPRGRAARKLNSAAIAGKTTMGRSIAIVEDEPAIRANYVEALNRFGYATQGYASRPDASRAFAQRLPELV